MRTRMMILTGALLLVFSGAARAQQEPVSQVGSPASVSTPSFAPKLGQIDFGFRADNLSGDAARYQRFRDLREGGYVDRFRFAKDTDQWAFRAAANNVGYRDQRFSVSYRDFGRLKIDADWNQVPLFISDSTATLYKDNGQGVLTIDDSIQSALQTAGSGAPLLSALQTFYGGASRYDLRSRRDIGSLNLVYTLNQDIDVKFDLRNTNRNGYNLMSFGFGTSPGLNPVVELGVPTDDRTTDVKGSLEFANSRGLVDVGYTASWFTNHIPTVQFDNPLRVQDISGGPASGRAVMWPTNHAFAVNVNGSYNKLPGRSRATAFLSIGQWDQNQPLVSPTVNSAIALLAPPLERATAEAKADIATMIYNFNSRPNDYLWLNAKYRYYNYDNKTPVYDTLALVGDWAPGTAQWENEPSSLKRKTTELDASFTPHKYLGIGVGFSREDTDRTHRIFEKTAEDTFRVSLDSTANQYVTLRTKFEHSNREGSGFEAALLEEVGEQADTRHFDIANRKRDRFTTTLSITPVNYLDFTAAVGTGKDNYGETGFGLRNNDNRTWSFGVDVLPTDRVNLGVNYGEEKYTALQYSRTANPLSATDVTFNDATRDWWTDQADKVKTFTASADFLKCLPKTDIRVGYDISDGNATYVYNLKPDQKVFTTIPLIQLPALKNKLTDGRVDVQYYVRPNLALGGAYWYEDYRVDDFALSQATLNSLVPANGTTGAFASAIYSGYLYRNYRAHTGWLRLTFLW